MKHIKNKKGFGFVDSGVKILIAVVIGAVLLGGTYAVANETVMPTVKTKIESLFDYSGEVSTETKIQGDINGDGVLNDDDLSILKNALLGNVTGYDNSALDVNEDGEVNVKDVARLKKLIAAQST